MKRKLVPTKGLYKWFSEIYIQVNPTKQNKIV